MTQPLGRQRRLEREANLITDGARPEEMVIGRGLENGGGVSDAGAVGATEVRDSDDVVELAVNSGG